MNIGQALLRWWAERICGFISELEEARIMPSVITWTISVASVGLAFAVWQLLASAAGSPAVLDKVRRRFASVSGACSGGWLALSFLLAGSGVFQADASRAFPALLIGIALALALGALLLCSARVPSSTGMNQMVINGKC